MDRIYPFKGGSPGVSGDVSFFSSEISKKIRRRKKSGKLFLSFCPKKKWNYFGFLPAAGEKKLGCSRGGNRGGGGPTQPPKVAEEKPQWAKFEIRKRSHSQEINARIRDIITRMRRHRMFLVKTMVEEWEKLIICRIDRLS